MNLFGSPPNPEDEEDQRLIAQGELPRGATKRLTEHAQRFATPDRLFTSTMSVNELLLTHDCGYEPIVQVMGTSAYHVGWQYLPGQSWGPRDPISGLPLSQEMAVLTEAYYDARRLAFGRLMKEAALVHADGVVGVTFERTGWNLPEGIFEFKVFGTAVRLMGAPPRTAQHKPFLSNLSGQDHWALRKAGIKPIGFVFGNCSWYQVSGWRNQSLDYSGWLGTNGEYPDFTNGIYSAREIAADRLTQEARSLGAAGVVGVTIEPQFERVEIDSQGGNARHDLLVQFTIFGTAIATDSYVPNTVKVATTIPLTG